MAWGELDPWRTDEGFCHAPERDRPLTFQWRLRTGDVFRALGIPSTRCHGIDTALRCIVAEAALAHQEGRWVSYSRRKAFYSGRQRYNGVYFTYANVLNSVERLVQLGLIEEDRAPPGQLGWQSRFRATPRLLTNFVQTDISYEPIGPIRLKDFNGHLTDYVDTASTIKMMQEMILINKILNSLQVELPGLDIIRTQNHLIVDGTYCRWTKPCLHRVFNRNSFNMGGRAFGWWQSLPKIRRQSLLIDGEAICEPDFAQLHPSLLYALRGVRLHGDAYETGEFSREHGKLAFNVAVNTHNRRGTLAALRNKPGWRLSSNETAKLLDALAQRNAPIAEDLHADRGIALMNLDSRIIIRAVRQCLEAGIPVLPVHDSMLTLQRYGSRVAEIMEASAEVILKRPKPCNVSVSRAPVSQMP